ncbi:MAG TPA: hypothetical protein VMV27_11470 [Candidatus Binataceae bacterium]|nr:hypothetical protein [Candidatus Binataceae bacterium]
MAAAEDAVTRIGALLEEMGARFDLVIEAVSGYGGRLDALRQELFAQFAEVGSQIRFLSDQIGENRSGMATIRADLGAEMIRLGETLGRTRVEVREQFGAAETALRREIGARAAESREHTTAVAVRAADDTGAKLNEVTGTAAKKITAELAKTNKALTSLARKFERFDDRITVATRDQDQRVRKLEQRRKSG